MSTMKRVVTVGALAAAVVLGLGAGSAAAADPHASCVGTIVSTLAPAGTFDVDDFKALAAAEGTRFGTFVSFGARAHNGTLEACLP